MRLGSSYETIEQRIPSLRTTKSQAQQRLRGRKWQNATHARARRWTALSRGCVDERGKEGERWWEEEGKVLTRNMSIRIT